jgi:hypothetical protein
MEFGEESNFKFIRKMLIGYNTIEKTALGSTAPVRPGKINSRDQIHWNLASGSMYNDGEVCW